jgi:hypothetical protein
MLYAFFLSFPFQAAVKRVVADENLPKILSGNLFNQKKNYFWVQHFKKNS